MERNRTNRRADGSRRKRLLGAAAAALVMGVAGAASANVILYGQPDLRGRSFVIDREVPNLDQTRWNDRASSLVIDRGRWEVCTDAYFRGQCRILGPGTYSTLGEFGDRISSVRPLYRGQWRNHPDNPRWWDDRAHWDDRWDDRWRR